MYRGLLTELAFAARFGLKVNDNILDHGDGGFDFVLPLSTPGGTRAFPVDIKAKSVRHSWDGLRASGTHLRIPVKEIKPSTIYVFGIYLEPTDSAQVLRWDWGQAVLTYNQRASYKNGSGRENFIKPFETLRDLSELLERLVRKKRRRKRPADPRQSEFLI